MNDSKIERYDVNGVELLIMEDAGWEVWLNPQGGDFDGLCIGAGETRQTAVAGAVAMMEAAVDQLQQPQPDAATENKTR